MALNGLDFNLAVILKNKSHEWLGWLARVWGPSNLDLSCVSGFSCTISSVMVYYFFFYHSSFLSCSVCYRQCPSRVCTDNSILSRPSSNESFPFCFCFKKEEEKRKKEPDVMKTLGEWGVEERGRESTNFEKENPNIFMLDGTGDFKNM